MPVDAGEWSGPGEMLTHPVGAACCPVYARLLTGIRGGREKRAILGRQPATLPRFTFLAPASLLDALLWQLEDMIRAYGAENAGLL